VRSKDRCEKIHVYPPSKILFVAVMHTTLTDGLYLMVSRMSYMKHFQKFSTNIFHESARLGIWQQNTRHLLPTCMDHIPNRLQRRHLKRRKRIPPSSSNSISRRKGKCKSDIYPDLNLVRFRKQKRSEFLI